MAKGRNIGRGLSLLWSIQRAWDMDEEFGRAMGAPMGELRPLIDRGRARYMRRVKRQIKAITGLKFRVFLDECERRTSSRWMHFSSYSQFCEYAGGVYAR